MDYQILKQKTTTSAKIGIELDTMDIPGANIDYGAKKQIIKRKLKNKNSKLNNTLKIHSDHRKRRQVATSNSILSYNNTIKLYQNNINNDKIYVLADGILRIYQYISNTWQILSETKIQAYDLIFADILNNGKDMIIAKTEEGISFYQNDKLTLLAKSNDFDENQFNDVYRWNENQNIIKYGNFYNDKNLFGILTKHEEYGINLFAVMKDQLIAGEYPIWQLDADFSIFGNSTNINIFLADLSQEGRDNIITYSKDGINIYKFNENDIIEHIMHVYNSGNLSDSEENFHFPNLTGQTFRDILIVNSNGLFIYQYKNEISNYKFLNYNPLFSKLNGWNKEYINSIQFQDVDSDGRDDIIFTGPEGIDMLSFNNYTYKWETISFNLDLTIPKLHSNVLKLLYIKSEMTAHPIIFSTYKNNLNWNNIEIKDDFLEEDLIDEIDNKTSLITTTVPVIPMQLQHKDEKDVLLLRDRLDCSSIIDSVDTNTGQIKFKLPLIDLSNMSSDIKLDFSYDAKSESSILGVGWSIPQNFIMVNYQSSVFAEDEKFYISIEGVPQELIFNNKLSTSTVYVFKFPNDQKDLQIRYYKDKERWELIQASIKQVYGRSSSTDAINWDIIWENWRGAGSSFKKRKQIATAWYLTEIFDNSGNYIKYTYDSVNILSNDNSFTQEIYLTGISDGQRNQITFRYSNKTKSEYTIFPQIDKNGNINTHQVHTRYLHGYALTTTNYQQNITFEYMVKNGQRLLTEIRQQDDILDEAILNFSYKHVLNSHILEKIILPKNVNVELDYEMIQSETTINNKIGLRYDVEKNYKIDYGTDDVLISYLDKTGNVVLRMFTHDMKEELYSSISTSVKTRFPLLGRGLVKDYVVYRTESFFAVILYKTAQIQICLFHKQDDKCPSVPKYYEFNKDAIIKFGQNFIVVATKSMVETISWNTDFTEWQKKIFFINQNSNKLFIAASGRIFIIYDDDSLRLGYINRDDVWKSKTIKRIPGILKNITTTLDKFVNIDSKIHRQLLNYFENNLFQLNNNLLVLNGWMAQDFQIYSNINLFTLGRNYDIVHEQQFKIVQDNLSTISQELDNKQGTFFTVIYKYINDKFKIIVSDFKGKILDDINAWSKNQTQRDKVKKEVCTNATKSLGNIFLIKLEKYRAELTSQTLLCNNKEITFNGNMWNMKTISQNKHEVGSIPLSNKFILHKENSTFKLYKKGNDQEKFGNSLENLEITKLKHAINRYPMYLAYQENNNEISVIEFFKDITKTYYLPQEEKLNHWSSYHTIVTSIDSEHSTTLVFRQHRHLLPNPVIKKVTINFDNDNNKRITGYEYNSAKVLGNTVYYTKTHVIKGNDKLSFGWIEEYKDFNNQTNVKRNIFDAQGNLIKTLKIQEQKKGVEEEDNERFTILDKTGKLDVAQFSPYKIEDEEVSYYGFEDYEVKNSTNKWTFDAINVQKLKYSYTGQNHLSISKRHNLEGVFQPNNQNQEYLASCWVRPHSKLLKLGSVTPYLKAIVYTENDRELFGFLGEVKLNINDWFYLEVVVDLMFAKQIDKGLTVEKRTLRNDKLKIAVIVASGADSIIDIDHIRFSPLNSNFQANVYDSNTRQITETISAGGFVKRLLYDKYVEEIATINEFGQLEEFNTYTKSSSIGKINQHDSIVRIKPENGFYEDFSAYSFYKRWRIDDDAAWKIFPGQLYHLSNTSHTLKLNLENMNSDSNGMRLCFSLTSIYSEVKFNNEFKLVRNSSGASIILTEKQRPIPIDGEILLILEHHRLFVWIDGGLYIDSLSIKKNVFNLEIIGMVKISNLMVFIEPNIQVTYLNAIGEKLQDIFLETADAVIVKEYLYDELGRQSITTQPSRIRRLKNQTMLAYYSNFVTNKKPYSTNSVWKIGKLQGDISKIIDEYSYNQIKYNNNPLNEEQTIGRPGKEFSVSGTYAIQFSTTLNNLFVKNFFPSKKFNYKIEHKPGLVDDISVYDHKNNRVAWYIHVPGSKDLLSTYEYDDNNRLVKQLPPLYHEKIRTFHETYSEIMKLSREKKALQNLMGTHIRYNKKGDIISETTADSGKVEHLYNTNGLVKFTLHYSFGNNNDIETVIYYDYDLFGRLISSGELISPPSKEKLLTLPQLLSNNSQEYQQFYHSDFEREPLLRGKLKRTITFNDGEPFIEESILDLKKQFVSKRIIIPTKNDDEPLNIVVNKKYSTGKLSEIEYPLEVNGQPFKLTYQYDKLGKVIGVGIPGQEDLYAKFTYNADKKINTEEHLPNTEKNFIRQYRYNSPGFLTLLEDTFLTEEVFYTDGSYGGHGYGDGTITRTKFEAKWHKVCDNSKLGINKQSFISNSISAKESEQCFDKLKQMGYINKQNRQEKIYYSALETKLPIICSSGITGRHIQKILGENGFPTMYGHSYDYGNHQELTKAKYFIGNDTPIPLQPGTFSKEILNINNTVSHDIWQILRKSMYIIDDDGKIDFSMAQAKRGRSFIRETLYTDLKNLNINYVGYKLPLERFLETNCFKPLSVLKSNLQDAFTKWNNKLSKASINKIIEMLEKNQYLQNPLTEEFKNALTKYQLLLPKIVHILSKHFATQLGEAEFDVESYGIDANGNHKHYYTGFDRYELNYTNNTNQAKSVKFKSYSSSKPENNFSMKHDSQGNVIQALHKGIQNIIYNKITNRATTIKLVDGRTIHFYYDAQGERVLKRIINSQNQTTKEIHYIRDEFGRALVEKQITYISPDLPPDVLLTAYIYGPRGLLGFIRRDEYYSVISDHEGSIRLVVKSGEVVAAYDYLPYGSLMRKYGNNPEAHISYRYTSQEWDEEIGLYNYHSRLYDPSIGRFFQIDPKCQYFSPYKYAGNSPISMIDPDGQFAFLLISAIVLAIVGSYLGGAAANNNWNPRKWDFSSPKTYLGILGGGITGALLPVGVGASVAALTGIGFSTSVAVGITASLGAVTTYLGTAAANNEWDLSKWDYSSPVTWNAAFQGFAIGSGAVGGIHAAKSFYTGLASSAGKGFFIASTVGSGSVIFVINAFNAEWDFSKPGVYFGFVDAITGAADFPMFAIAGKRFLIKNFKSIGKAFSNPDQVALGVRVLATSGVNVKNTLLSAKFYIKGLFSHSNYQFTKSSGKLIGAAAISVSSAVLSVAGEDEVNSPNSYYAFITGILTGGQLASSGKSFYKKQITKHVRKKHIKAEKLSLEVASDAVARYNDVLQTGAIDITSYKTIRVKDLLEGGQIPNTAIAVAITDKTISVGFSTNTAPGLAIMYTHDKLQNKIFKDMEVLKNNEIIAGKKIALSDHSETNVALHNAIEYVQNDIKQTNAIQFREETTKGRINSLLNEGPFQENIINKIINDIEEIIINKGYETADKIEQLITKHVVAHNAEIKTINENLLSKRDVRANYIKEKKTTKINEIKTEILNLNNELKKATKRVEAEFSQNIKDLKLQIVNILDGFEPKVTLWEPTNCAEPHALAILSRKNILFPSQRPESKNFNIKDVNYMSTYKLSTTELTAFPRCDHCLQSTKYVKNVLTDTDWLSSINDQYRKMSEKFNIDKLRLIFLAPILNTQNRFVVHNITNDTKHSGSIRMKRFASKDPDVKNNLNNNIPIIKINNPDKVNLLKSKSVFDNLFIWAKNSLNGLLNSSSLNAEIPSNSNMSQIDTQIDTNGSILLLDTFIRKITGQKYVINNTTNMSSQEVNGFALNIIMKFETIVKEAARYSISIHRLDINFIEIQKELIKAIISGKLDNIAGILNAHVEKTCNNKDTRFGKLSQKKYDKFINKVNRKLDVELNEIIQEILNFERGSLEVNRIKQSNSDHEKVANYLDFTIPSQVIHNKSTKGIYIN